MTHNWETLAGNRWPNDEIHGLGRFAIRSERGGVYLYPTRAQADVCAAFHNCTPVDLQGTPVPEHCVDVYDVEEARRERREKRQEIQ